MDKHALIASSLPTRDVEVPGKGPVTVRGLSRKEVFNLQGIAASDRDRFEVQVLHHGIVEPKLDKEDIESWRESAPAGEIEPVVNAVLDASGLLPETVKQLAKDFLADADSSSSSPGT